VSPLALADGARANRSHFHSFWRKTRACVASLFLFAKRNQDVPHLDSFQRKDRNIRRILIPFRRKEQKWSTS
jgi:hypothetical protein